MAEELGFAAVADAKRRCRLVLRRIKTLATSTNITLSSKGTLHRLARSELTFLSSSSLNPPPSVISVNIGHLEAVVHILEQPFVTGVSRVCKPIPLHPVASNGIVNAQTRPKGVHVDIVCTVNGKPVWFIVSDRNPKHISWNGYQGNNNKGLKLRIQQVLAAAGSSNALRPSSVILFFSRGLEEFIQEKLRDEFRASLFEMGFPRFDYEFDEELEGDWINVVARSYQAACVLEIKIDCVEQRDTMQPQSGSLEVISYPSLSETAAAFGDTFSSLIRVLESLSPNEEDLLVGCDLINFDTTTLIALVSGISNGGTRHLLAAPESELKQRFKGNYDFVIAQAKSEIQNPIQAKLCGIVSGRKGMVCETVLSEFKELVLMCGGPNEKFRADRVLKHLIASKVAPS